MLLHSLQTPSERNFPSSQPMTMHSSNVEVPVNNVMERLPQLGHSAVPVVSLYLPMPHSPQASIEVEPVWLVNFPISQPTQENAPVASLDSPPGHASQIEAPIELYRPISQSTQSSAELDPS